jgi:HEAT repeat protein
MRFAGLLALALLAAPATAETPEDSEAERSVEAVFRNIDRLQAQQENQNARQRALLDERCLALAPQALSRGWRSAAPLSAVLRDRSRPPKIRLLAASFLGLSRDPAAFPPLRSLLADPAEPAELRSAAAQSLPGLGVSKAALRQALCPVLAEKNLPQEVLTAALIGLAPIGCDEPALLEGPARGREAPRALTALAHSLPPSAVQSLLRLLKDYPPGSPLQEAALQALRTRRQDLAFFRGEADRIFNDLEIERERRP